MMQQSPIAVLLRTHTDDPKVRHSVDALSAGQGYDFFVLAREDEQTLDFAPAAKVSHTMRDIRDLGFPCSTWWELIHRSDLLFPLVAQRLPGYSHYVIIEYDVLVQHPEHRFFDHLAQALNPPEAPDLVTTWLAPANPGWGWDAAVLRTYPKVIGSTFGVVALSARAAPYVLEERRREQAWADKVGVVLKPNFEADNIMFCEAFLPSAIEANRGFKSTDLNALVPGAYTASGFRPGPARLFSEQLAIHEPGELIHPVVHDRDFLAKTLAHHSAIGDVAGYVERLRNRQWAVPVGLLEEAEERARQLFPDQVPAPA